VSDDWYPDNSWSETEIRLFADMAHDTDALQDRMLQSLFDTAYFDPGVSHDVREGARESLNEYILDVYGFDFDEWFDWDAWREAYGIE